MDEFTAEWAAVEHKVYRYCRARLRDDDITADVVQETCIRAWRGYPTFQRRSSFCTWVIAIAIREIANEKARPQPFVEMESVEETLADTQAAPVGAPASDVARDHRLRQAIADAVRMGHLDQDKADTLRSRLDDPEASWAQIGARLRLTAGHCAVLHLRGIQDLRAFMLLRCDPALGGRRAVEDAFAGALAAKGEDRLTDGEAEAFRRCALADPRQAPSRGQMTLLRSASVKIAAQLSV